MNKLATTKLSSRGQIVIPEEIREQMHMHTGDQFIVFAEKDIVILKAITRPEISEFNTLVTKARRKAAESSLTSNTFHFHPTTHVPLPSYQAQSHA